MIQKTGQIIGYVRVSTVQQNIERQLETMRKYNCEKIFTDKATGRNTNRPKLQELLDYVRSGDTVVVHDFSRMARSTQT